MGKGDCIFIIKVSIVIVFIWWLKSIGFLPADISATFTAILASALKPAVKSLLEGKWDRY